MLSGYSALLGNVIRQIGFDLRSLFYHANDGLHINLRTFGHDNVLDLGYQEQLLLVLEQRLEEVLVEVFNWE